MSTCVVMIQCLLCLLCIFFWDFILFSSNFSLPCILRANFFCGSCNGTINKFIAMLLFVKEWFYYIANWILCELMDFMCLMLLNIQHFNGYEISVEFTSPWLYQFIYFCCFFLYFDFIFTRLSNLNWFINQVTLKCMVLCLLLLLRSYSY